MDIGEHSSPDAWAKKPYLSASVVLNRENMRKYERDRYRNLFSGLIVTCRAMVRFAGNLMGSRLEQLLLVKINNLKVINCDKTL